MITNVRDRRSGEKQINVPAIDQCTEVPAYVHGIGIIEDDAEIVKVLKLLFSRYGIPVCFTAKDGPDSILIFRSLNARPKVILMDYRLTGMNGIDAMKELIGLDPDLRVIFLSADYDAIKEALDAGAWAFISKPAGIKEIMAAVNDALS